MLYIYPYIITLLSLVYAVCRHIYVALSLMSIVRNDHQSLSQLEGRWKSMQILSFQSDFLKTDLNSNAGAEDRGESGSS